MEIEKAAEMGFCFGVKRAVDLMEETARELGPLESLGAMVHNRQVVDKLAQHGVHIRESLDVIEGNIIAIPSHGVAPDVIEQMKSRGCRIVDATCPYVRKAQVMAQRLSQDDFDVLVFGEAAHPEVAGVLSWANGRARAALDVPADLPRRLGILSQTTQSQAAFASFVAGIILTNKVSEIRIFNTLCDATRKQQAAAIELAGKVDLMIVVGGMNSANTRRLAQLCSGAGVATHHIETAEQIDPSWFRGRRRIGVTAGASTPADAIDEVVRAVEELGKERALPIKGIAGG